VVVITECRPFRESAIVREAMLTRMMLNVVWNRCSRLAWYRSLTFSK
jgi:hypothetical protein